MASRPVLSVPQPTLTLAVDNVKLREHCDQRARIMQSSRSEVDPLVTEVSQLTQPLRSRFAPGVSVNGGSASTSGSTAARRSRVRSRMLLDGHGTRASEILQNGMNSGLSSPSGEWFALKLPALHDAPQSFPGKQWLSAAQDVMYSFLADTNFYEAAKSGYGELGLFGTEACFMEEHWKHGLVCHALTFGEYWIAEGDDRRVDTLLRWVPMTIRQIVEKFLVDPRDRTKIDWTRASMAMRSAWDAGNKENVFDVLHLCEPNPEYDPLYKDFRGRAWRSVYWDPKSDAAGKLLMVDGSHEQPFWAARWDTLGGGDPWGTGPGFAALPDLAALQLNSKKLGDGTDLALRPPLVGPGTTKIKLHAGAYTAAGSMDKGAVFPVYQVPYQALEMIDQAMGRYYKKIDEAFYVDLFMAITEMDGVQPRNNEEIFSRNEEKLTQLGPVITRVNVEKLGVAVERVFGICTRRQIMPDAPEDIHGAEVSTDFVSTLARAQRAAGLGTWERTLGFLGNMAGVFSGVTDNVDSDAIGREYWERSGAPAIGLRDPAEVQKMRAERAQAAAAEQARQSAPAMAQGAQAAELLSKTDMRGSGQNDTALSRLLGGSGGL